MDDPNTVYETDQREFVLGRSKQCAIVIHDPHISRVQARIRFQDNRYTIENRGRNPIHVNGLATTGQFLNAGDEITLGKTNLRFQTDPLFDDPPQPMVIDDQTIAVTSLQDQVLGPRLALTTNTGATKTYPLFKTSLFIGRSEDADIDLKDPSVSRKHGIIELRDNGYYVKNFSQTNPLLLNDGIISETRLYSGDHIRIGSNFLTFISDRPEDAKPAKEKIVTKKKGPGWALWLTAASLLLIVAALIVYRHVYHPWKINRNLDSIAGQIAAGDYQVAQDALKHMLTMDLTPTGDRKAKDLLAQTALAIVQQMAQAGRLSDAKQYLIVHLREYGGGSQADSLRKHLDLYRIDIARSLEAAAQHQAALGEYAAVREDSPFYDHAQQGIRRIWLASQQDKRRHQNLSQLLQEADRHFRAKRFLTPVNNNAYSVYQSLLAIEPDHPVALARIEQMKAFYRGAGERYFNQENWRRALTYFERHNFIAPGTPDIQQKIDLCRAKLSPSKTKGPAPRQKAATPGKNREQVKQLLEESGVESSRIIQFLFEDSSGETESEKPW
jgi:pSer/pThr/pTyr-binding forkhead associated (FHA) protein